MPMKRGLAVLKRPCHCCAKQGERENAASKESCDLLLHGSPASWTSNTAQLDDGRMVYLWRAVDAEGEVLDVLVQSKRNKHAALKLMRKLLKKYAFAPERLVTDDLRSYGAAARDLGLEHLHERGRWKNSNAI